jgi:hypothetical protein
MVTAWVTASDPWMTLLQPTCCNLQNRPSQCMRPLVLHRAHMPRLTRHCLTRHAALLRRCRRQYLRQARCTAQLPDGHFWLLLVSCDPCRTCC